MFSYTRFPARTRSPAPPCPPRRLSPQSPLVPPLLRLPRSLAQPRLGLRRRASRGAAALPPARGRPPRPRHRHRPPFVSDHRPRNTRLLGWRASNGAELYDASKGERVLLASIGTPRRPRRGLTPTRTPFSPSIDRSAYHPMTPSIPVSSSQAVADIVGSLGWELSADRQWVVVPPAAGPLAPGIPPPSIGVTLATLSQATSDLLG